MSGQLRSFVGRTRETVEMRAVLEEALAGRGGLVLLTGEPGIGKTSLADLIANEASQRGAQVAWGRCWEGGGAPAYWPWITVLRTCMGNRDLHAAETMLGHHAALIATLVPELRGPAAMPAELEQIPGLSNLTSGEPSHQRFRLFDSISTFLALLARDLPLMVVLDDCHAADPASLLLLRFIARDLRNLRLMLIVTYREAEVSRDPTRAELMAELGREGTRIALRGLTAADVAEFIEHSIGVPPHERSVEQLVGATDGNPFFLNEIVRLLIAERRLPERDAQGLGSFRIPDTVRVAIRRQVALISEEARNTLAVAAAVGREFDLALLTESCGLSVERLIATLDEAEACGLVNKIADKISHYSFGHALIRETLYDDLPGPEACELHLRIARSIERLHGLNLEPELAKLAYHYHAALPIGPHDKAVSYAQRAARNALTLLAYENAAYLYQLAIHALEMRPETDGLLKCELLLSLGEALHGCGLFNRARSAFERAFQSAKQIRSAEHMARAALGFGSPPSTPGQIDHALISLLDEARQTLGQNDSALLAMVQARMASELFWGNDPRRSELASRALEIARRLNEPFALVYVLFMQHTAVWEPDNLNERLTVSSEIIKLAENPTYREWALVWGLRARYLRFADLLELGDVRAVDSEIEQYSRLATELHQHLGYYELVRATRALMDGRFEDAERLANQTLEVAGRLERRTHPFRQAVNSQTLILRREQDRLNELEPRFRSNRESVRRSGLAMAEMAFCYSELGRRMEARTIFEELAERGFASLPRNKSWYATMVLLSEVCCFLEDSSRAATLYQMLVPSAERNAVLDIHVCYGSVAHYLGMLAVTIGETDKAEAHFKAALSFNLRMGARPWVARTRYHYAAMLVARGYQGDREKAAELAELAHSVAESIGMNALVREIRELWGVDLRSRAAPDGTVTIVFTDVENSTPIIEKLGDRRAQDLLNVHNAIIREQVAAHNGFEVKTMGDAFMIAFSSARTALLCAIAIQRELAAYAVEHPETALRVAVGVHTGEAIQQAGDFYGKAVIIASRIAAQARGGEILISSTLKELTENSGDLRFDAGRDVELKGLSGSFHLYSVIWQNLT